MKKPGSKVLPLGAQTSGVAFSPQFHAMIDLRSLATTPILYFDHTGVILPTLHATGFFFKHDGRVFLCSARHCFSGKDALSDETMSPTGYIPPRIGIYPSVNLGHSTARLAAPLEIDLVNAEGAPLWIGDPEFSSLRTDIACIEIKDETTPYIRCVNEIHERELYVAAGATCFILGYPNRNFAEPYIPIWRRGSFASEPSLPVDGKPLFLVDAQTSEGMSGSPILQVWFGPVPFYVGSDQPEIKLEGVMAARLVGVYGGRLSSKNQMAEVGLGWYANRIPLILASATTE